MKLQVALAVVIVCFALNNEVSAQWGPRFGLRPWLFGVRPWGFRLPVAPLGFIPGLPVSHFPPIFPGLLGKRSADEHNEQTLKANGHCSIANSQIECHSEKLNFTCGVLPVNLSTLLDLGERLSNASIELVLDPVPLGSSKFVTGPDDVDFDEVRILSLGMEKPLNDYTFICPKENDKKIVLAIYAPSTSVVAEKRLGYQIKESVCWKAFDAYLRDIKDILVDIKA